jgi:hypothetical protein
LGKIADLGESTLIEIKRSTAVRQSRLHVPVYRSGVTLNMSPFRTAISSPDWAVIRVFADHAGSYLKFCLSGGRHV